MSKSSKEKLFGNSKQIFRFSFLASAERESLSRCVNIYDDSSCVSYAKRARNRLRRLRLMNAKGKLCRWAANLLQGDALPAPSSAICLSQGLGRKIEAEWKRARETRKSIFRWKKILALLLLLWGWFAETKRRTRKVCLWKRNICFLRRDVKRLMRRVIFHWKTRRCLNWPPSTHQLSANHIRDEEPNTSGWLWRGAILSIAKMFIIISELCGRKKSHRRIPDHESFGRKLI